MQHRNHSSRYDHNHLIFADVIRAFAIIMVVVLHVAAYPVVQFQMLDRQDWWMMNIIDSLSRPAVPLFVMVSGMFLLDPAKQEGVVTFFRKRLARIAAPFLGWAIVYLIWRMTFHGESISWDQAAREILQGPVYVHFWFMYMIIGLYILTPIIRSCIRNAGITIQLYCIFVWFIFLGVFPMLDRVMGLQLGVYLGVLQFVGYFIMGFMLREIRLNRLQMQLMLLMFAGMAGVTAIGTFILTSMNSGVLDELFYNNTSPNVIFMSVALFLVLKSVNYQHYFSKRPGYKSLVTWISSASFTIYFCHFIFIELFQSGILGFKLYAMTLTPLVGLPITTLSVVALSSFLTAVIRPIPVLKEITP